MPRCPECGFRIRGKNHEEGVHHKEGDQGSTGKATDHVKSKGTRRRTQ